MPSLPDKQLLMMRPTYHLNENTSHHHNPKDIGTDMCQLVVSGKSQFESDTKSLIVSSFPTTAVSRQRKLALASDIP